MHYDDKLPHMNGSLTSQQQESDQILTDINLLVPDLDGAGIFYWYEFVSNLPLVLEDQKKLPTIKTIFIHFRIHDWWSCDQHTSVYSSKLLQYIHHKAGVCLSVC